VPAIVFVAKGLYWLLKSVIARLKYFVKIKYFIPWILLSIDGVYGCLNALQSLPTPIVKQLFQVIDCLWRGVSFTK